MKKLSALLLTMMVAFSSLAKAETVYLTSLEWPPYSSAELPNQGASIAVAKAAFAAMGYQLEVEFYPWSRAVALATRDEKYAGYFPEYWYESDEFSFSDPMGIGPLGFVENVNKPITWRSINDLTAYRIGTVQDYVNTDELDAMIANGSIKAEPVTSDARNILKVAAGRIDMAVIDSNVFSFLTAHDAQVTPVADRVKMNSKLLVDKELFVAFKNTPGGKQWKDIFNAGLAKIDVEAIMAQHM